MPRSSQVLLAGLVASASPLAAQAERPNIVVVFTDDHGYADLSTQGVVDDIRTPHIDALARTGVRFSSGYATAPQCVPSRAGLLTGRYQNRFGVERNGQPLAGFHAELTVAERLQRAGYATGMTGKWHLGPSPEIVQHGFDAVYAKSSARPGWANFALDGSDREPGRESSKLYHIDANTAAACAFIERHRRAPFFFYCAYRAPHVPLDAPAQYLARFPGEMPERRRQALAMLSAVDDGVGRIVAKLREHDLEQKTLVFLIGDNGAPLKIHKTDAPGRGAGWDGSLNDPLNGEKGMLTEGGIRVPFVAAWPGRIPGGRTDHRPVVALDVAATAVALAGLPRDPELDGVDLTPFLTRDLETAPHPRLYWRWVGQAAVREGKWKYLRGGPREYLFDLDADRGEQHDVAAQHPATTSRLRSALAAWAAQLDPPGLPTTPLPRAGARYFDHYLDGKPAENPMAQPGERPAKGKAQGGPRDLRGWVVRNATAVAHDGVLRVRQQPGARRAPFLAAARLDLPPGTVAVVRLRTQRAGTAAITWREAGQKDFGAAQRVAFACAGAATETHETALPARKNIIQVRLLLPPGGADVEHVVFRNAAGKAVKSWRFDRGRSPR